MEKLCNFTLLVRDRSEYLTSRYSARKDAAPMVVTHLTSRAMHHEVSARDATSQLSAQDTPGLSDQL
jgi:arsenic resistance protein ArsH